MQFALCRLPFYLGDTPRESLQGGANFNLFLRVENILTQELLDLIVIKRSHNWWVIDNLLRDFIISRFQNLVFIRLELKGLRFNLDGHVLVGLDCVLVSGMFPLV